MIRLHRLVPHSARRLTFAALLGSTALVAAPAIAADDTTISITTIDAENSSLDAAQLREILTGGLLDYTGELATLEPTASPSRKSSSRAPAKMPRATPSR